MEGVERRVAAGERKHGQMTQENPKNSRLRIKWRCVIISTVNRSHQIRLYPNKEQRIMLAKTAGTVRYCYNWGLSKWNEMYQNGENCNTCLLSRLWTKERPE